MHHTLLHNNNETADEQYSKANRASNQSQPSSTYVSTCIESNTNEPFSINKPTISSVNDPASFNQTSRSNLQSTLSNKAKTNQNSQIYHCLTKAANSPNIKFLHIESTANALLSTVTFNIIDEFGITHKARSLLDSGSQTTLISDYCVKRIGLHRHKSYVKITGLGSQKAGTTRGEVKLNIVSKSTPENFVTTRALILGTLTSRLPTNNIDGSQWPIIQKLDLADPSYDTPGIVDVILGNDVFNEILLPQKIQIADHLFAQATIFGWVIGGHLGSRQINSANYHTTVSNNEGEIELLKRFWEVEEFSISSTSIQNSGQEDCEGHYKHNTTRTKDGRYIVRLPFKASPPHELGTTYHHAKRRFFGLERKFNNHPEAHNDYVQFMTEYEDLGHMERIEFEHSNVNHRYQGYHLPHHCVVKETSSTTKLRVVFDGSCKSTTGHSLNDMLLVGPTIQDDIMIILLRFRTHKIAISADIEKMYRQIIIHPADRDFQRIIWRQSPTQELQQFRLTTVTYGTSSAPFLACRTLHQLANDCHEIYPDAANRLKSDFYVDDMLTGCDDLNQATKIYEEMTSLLKSGGFKLRKWMTNDDELTSRIEEADRDSNWLEVEGISMVKTLGLLWNPLDDTFNFRVTLEDTRKASKRTLGWLSPSIILIKILFQQLWLQKLNWDDDLPEDIRQNWMKLRSSLHHLQVIKIPRFIFTRKQNMNIQLHGFSDASELAYGAAVYIRVQDPSNNTTVNLLTAKTKVCPIKQLSIPRLELCAAVLLCRLMTYVQTSIKLEINAIYAWTDSQIVLAWLSDIPRRWKCFIGNRTSFILEHLPRNKWSYVPSKENPADLASRGVIPQHLMSNKLWWNGPEWLSKDEQYWPNMLAPSNPLEDHHTELRKRSKQLYIDQLSLMKGSILPPTVDEMVFAETACIKWVQAEIFSDTLQQIKQLGEVKKGNILSSLTPFIDEQGLLRVGGRISNASCSFDTKHPIILPQNHVYTGLIVDKYHRENIHPGPTLLTSLIRQRFWIIGCRKVTRWRVQRCILCFMRKRKQNQQLMADLPIERVSIGRPFLNTGVDYAGPLYIVDRKGPGRHRVTKAYIALFICLSVKAVHIEMVTDMTSEAFIAALKRFISRRGIPSQLHCDNGSNFVGARNELHTLYHLFKCDSHIKLIYEFLSPQRIRFKFNPPRAPHFGGLWESNIKSIKSHFYRVARSTSFTFEEANTLLIQIEAVLNSRPLCGITNDVTSYDVLTPAHFLIGEPLVSIPEPNLYHIKSNRLSKWQNIQNRVQSFWKLWSTDYLSTLNQRSKWRAKSENLNIGQLVLIQDDNIPQTHWITGRIQQVHCGNDGHIRVATVKTTNGTMKRPIVKLIPLPIEDDKLHVTRSHESCSSKTQ